MNATAASAANGACGPFSGLRQVADAGEHHREQDEDRYRAAVDEHLDDRQELRGEQDEDAGDGDQRQDQEQRGVHDVPGGDDAQRADDGDGGDEVEDDLFVAHAVVRG